MSASKTGVVILARYSSSRLPGKALMKIKGKAVLTYIIERVQRAVPSEQIILATSTETSDDAIVTFAREQNIKCHRGSLENVAQRFYDAAKALNCEYACRINGDNIFLDAEVLQSMITEAEKGKYEFLSNVKNRTFPKGMSIEIVDLDYYAQHLRTINGDAYYREHVMVYLYERSEEDRHFYLQNMLLPEAAGLQLALDTSEDFARSRWIMERLTEPHFEAGMAEILKIFKEYEKSVEG